MIFLLVPKGLKLLMDHKGIKGLLFLVRNSKPKSRDILSGKNIPCFDRSKSIYCSDVDVLMNINEHQYRVCLITDDAPSSLFSNNLDHLIDM